MPDDALHALRDAAMRASHFAPGFCAWIKHVSEWEFDRRAGFHYVLLFPEELAPPRDFVRGAHLALTEMGRALGGSGSAGTGGAGLLVALQGLVRSCERYK